MTPCLLSEWTICLTGGTLSNHEARYASRTLPLLSSWITRGRSATPRAAGDRAAVELVGVLLVAVPLSLSFLVCEPLAVRTFAAFTGW
jgi:hypothetical protein